MIRDFFEKLKVVFYIVRDAVVDFFTSPVNIIVMAGVALVCCFFYVYNTVHFYSEPVVTPPTATSFGSTYHKCKLCGRGVTYDETDPTSYNMPSVIISEVCSLNGGQEDEDGEYYDWVEIYNPTDRKISLNAFGISDDEYNLFKCTLPAVVLEPGEYTVVYCTGVDGAKKSTSEITYAAFGLSAEGETIYLTNPVGVPVDKMTFPACIFGRTYGRLEQDGEVTYQTLMATPGGENVLPLPAPEFSAESGFYANEFSLDLIAPAGYTIFYTTDGSIPENDVKKAKIYRAPIEIKDATENQNVYRMRTDIFQFWSDIPDYKVDKCTVIRAVAYDEYGNKSDVITKSYFVGQTAAKYEGENIVSLVTDPANLFDGASGIYVRGYNFEKGLSDVPNWQKKGIEWERPASLAFFNADGYNMTKEAGIRVRGALSRKVYYKSFNVYARKYYDGTNLFDPPVIPNTAAEKSLVLRSVSYFPYEGFLQNLVSDRSFSTQKYEDCTLFLDGELWNKYIIMEKYGQRYFENQFGVARDKVTIIKDGGLDDGLQSDYEEYKNLLSFIIARDMSNAKNYEQIEAKMDLQGLADIYCTAIYLDNLDFSYDKNFMAWRASASLGSKYEDGKWRYALYDLDSTCGKYDNDTFTTDMNSELTQKICDDAMLASLMKNQNFREMFVNSFMDMANVNFNKASVLPKLAQQYDDTDSTYVDFFANRYDYIIDYLADFVGDVGERVTLSLSVNDAAGGIKLNTTTPDLSGGEWSGEYYDRFTQSVTALPADGYHFVRWEINGVHPEGNLTDATFDFALVAGSENSVRAIFEAD